MSAPGLGRSVVRAVACAVTLGGLAASVPMIAQEQSRPTVRTGRPDAPAQLTVFCDFEVKACGALIRVIGRVLENRPDAVAVTFRHLAPAGHPRSPFAYRAARAAARQGGGWAMLDLLYANPDQREGEEIGAMAARLGLDPERFVRDIDDPVDAKALEADAAEAARLDVRSTPALFLNGSRLSDSFTYDAIVKALGL